MKASMLRRVAVPLLFFFGLATVTAPARAALFLVPPVMAAVGATATLTEVNAGLSAGVLAIGVLMSAIVLNNTSTPASQKVLTGSKVKTPTPPNYADPVAPSLEPNPPLVTSPYPIYVVAGIQFQTSPLDACTQTKYGVPSYWCTADCSSISVINETSTTFQCRGYGAAIGWGSADGNKVNGCKAGYTLSGGLCNLTNAGLVPLPVTESPTMRPSAGANPVLAQVPGSAAATVPTAVQSGVNAQNQPMSISVNPLPLPNGQTGTTTKFATQTADANGVTMTKTSTVTTDENGVITGVVTTLLPTDLAGAVQTGASTGGVSAPVTFPTDYNREATQQEILAKQSLIESEAKTYQEGVKTDRDAAAVTAATLAETLKVGGPPPPIPPPADVSHWGLPTLSMFQSFDLGLTDKIPAGTGCSGIPVTILGQTTSLDPCPVVEGVKPLINWMIIFLGVISGVFVFLKPDEVS